MSNLEALREKVRKMESSSHSHGVLPFGVAEIDDCLPNGGLSYGALHEVAGGGNGALHGAAAALFVAGIMARTTGSILWCVKQRDLFAPGIAQAGLALDRVIFVEAGDEKAVLACFEEGLRHGGMTGVVGEVGKLPMIASRRLQLAAESSGAIGIAIRRWWKLSDTSQLSQPNAARTRWRVNALPSMPLPVAGIGRACWSLDLMRCRSGESANFEVGACDEEGRISLLANMADGPRQTATEQLRAVS